LSYGQECVTRGALANTLSQANIIQEDPLASPEEEAKHLGVSKDTVPLDTLAGDAGAQGRTPVEVQDL
jgi:hypothetical protein